MLNTKNCDETVMNPNAAKNLKPFKKGVDARRNIAGRPKLTLLSEAIRAQLSELLPGKSEQTYAEMIARALIDRAMNGDVMAAREVADRSEGKARQPMDVDLSVMDWRQMAAANGLSEKEVIDEARKLIEQTSGHTESDFD